MADGTVGDRADHDADRGRHGRSGAGAVPSPAPRPPTPSALPAPTAPPSGSHLGMPIRVPQANMAPQLRDAPTRRSRRTRRPGHEPWFGARSPEATRSMLTMMQQGWRRGRMDDLDDPEGVPGTGTD